MAPMDVEYVQNLFEDYQSFLRKVPDASPTMLCFKCHPTYGTLLHSQTETACPNHGTFPNVIVLMAYSREELECRRVNDNVDGTTETGVGEYINYDG